MERHLRTKVEENVEKGWKGTSAGQKSKRDHRTF
jgi:hypothetical protein